MGTKKLFLRWRMETKGRILETLQQLCPRAEVIRVVLSISHIVVSSKLFVFFIDLMSTN